jgi:NADH-quinone oxidoreductase subunit J
MNAAAFFFYLFSGVLIASAFLVVTARNPVHSVLFLILAFVNAAGLFILLGAEFLAMILIVVYVGAVAVLFLFVIMMLDVDFAEFKQGFMQYLPIGVTIGGIVLVELIFVVGSWSLGQTAVAQIPTPAPQSLSNTAALGAVLYTQYAYLFEAAGFVLMTAMVGAIVLTLHHKVGIKRQSVAAQNARTAKQAVELKKVASRAGI